MSERILITKIVKTEATRAQLFGKAHKWPDLNLFDLGELEAVGLDPATLPIGQETPCRFWAVYELSEKLNAANNPYKDVIALEPIDRPATTTSTDTSAMLAELRAIRELLTVLVQAQGAGVAMPEPEADDIDEAFPRYGDGGTVNDNPAEREAFRHYKHDEGRAPQDLDTLRAWFLEHSPDH